MSDQHWQPVAALETIKQKARLLQSIRAFFAARDVLEVDTPSLSSAAVTDLHIESFATDMRQDLYLHTSPEYAMKRMLAAGFPSIYQVCKVYRREEQGVVHNPEFTMLEWYRLGFDYRELMAEVTELLTQLASLNELSVACEQISYQQAFLNTVAIDPLKTTIHELRECCIKYKLDIPQGMSDVDTDEWLDWVMTQAVAPAFNKRAFTILYDYPASQCALASISENGLVAERFEVFFGELELANGFNELTDSSEQRQRFESDNVRRRAAGLKPMPVDEKFLAALDAGLPKCAGVAIGLDRLVMVLSGKNTIAEVLAFPFDRC